MLNLVTLHVANLLRNEASTGPSGTKRFQRDRFLVPSFEYLDSAEPKAHFGRILLRPKEKKNTRTLLSHMFIELV